MYLLLKQWYLMTMGSQSSNAQQRLRQWNTYGYTQNDMAESLDVSYIHYSQIEQGRHRMSLELMLKIVTKYGVDPNTLFGIESREKHENKDLSVLEDKLQMLKPNDREYAMSTCLIFIEGLEARKEVV